MSMILRTILVCVCEFVCAMDPTTQDLLTPIKQYGEGCGYDICRNPKEGSINVHIVPHSHGELGYSRTFHDHFTGDDEFYDKSSINMKRILDATITELWSDPQRKFTLSSSELPYFFHWWSRRDGTVHRMVYQLLRQGRLYFVGGGWGMPDEASTSYQGIIDQFSFALRKLNASFLACGRPLVAWQVDNFGHSREMTSLLAQMGFDGLFINPISLEDELARMKEKNLEFLWRGSDDLGPETDLFTHKLFDGYWAPPGFCFSSMCGDPLIITSDSVFKNAEERASLFVESILNRQAPNYGTRHVMVMMGHRLGYHDAPLWFENIEKLITYGNGVGGSTTPQVYLYYSTPACYLKAVHGSNPLLKTKQDDFFPFAYDRFTYATGMYTSRPSVKLMVREGNVYLQMAKQLQVLARLGNNDKLFEKLNWIMGVFQDHNIISGAMRIYVKNYYTKIIYETIQSSTVLLRQAFNKMRKSASRVYYRCAFNESSCNVFIADRSSISIYNPLSWPVSMPVRLPVENEKYLIYDPKGELVKTAVMKIPSPVISLPERHTTADHELVFIATDLPPLGLRSYLIEKVVRRRVKKSLIKLKKSRQSKYYIQQTNQYPIDNKTFFGDDDESDYKDYKDYDEPTTKRQPNIQVGNIPKDNPRKDSDIIITPKPRKVVPTNDFVDVTEKPVVKGSTENYGFIADRRVFEMVTVKPVEKPTRTTTTTKPTTTVETTTVTTVKVENVTEPNVTVPNVTEPSVTVGNITVPSVTIENVTVSNITVENVPMDYVEDELNDYRKYVRHYEESSDRFIENEYIKISIDSSSHKVASVTLSNGVNTSLDIQFFYYVSDDPVKMKTPEKKPPGAYIFRAMDMNPDPIIDYVETKVYKSDVVSEIHCRYASYASFALKLYQDSPVIEVDWVAGPISVEDDLGKDVFIRYTTDLVNDGVFYTDSNGRQTVKRLRNVRPTYEPSNFDPVAGNIYPVTSRIYIEDLKKNIRLSIFNDRSQGGTCLYDGMVDLIVHRRILTDDSGIQSFLNETINGQGIVVRGKHYLYLTKANFKPNRVFEKKFAKEIELSPQVFACSDNVPKKEKWLEYKNEVLALKYKLPIGVHILTLEKWNDDTILIRLENYLEKVDVVKHGVKKVFLKDLFINIKVNEVKETTLGANIWLEDWTPLQWNKSEEFFKNFNEYYGSEDKEEYSKDNGLKPVEEVVLDDGITLIPQQIRTFVVWYTYTGDL